MGTSRATCSILAFVRLRIVLHKESRGLIHAMFPGHDYSQGPQRFG